MSYVRHCWYLIITWETIMVIQNFTGDDNLLWDVENVVLTDLTFAVEMDNATPT